MKKSQNLKLNEYLYKIGVSLTILIIYVITTLLIGIHGDEIKSDIPVHYVDFIAAMLTLPIVSAIFIKLPSFFYYQIIFFCVLSQYFGMMLNFYDKFKYYDKFLHSISGVLLATFGYYVFLQFVKISNLTANNKKPFLACGFTLLFSISGAAVWEIYEFTTDTFFNMTSQGSAIADTMTDIIAGTCGGIIGTIFLYIYLYMKNKKSID